MDARPEVAEALGTFALVFVGAGAIMADALTGSPGPLGIAFAFGAVVTVMVYAVGHVSGAHFNPAITVAFAASGHFAWKQVPGYVAAQLAGALAAAWLLKALLGPVGDVGATSVAGVSSPGAFVIEVAITFLLAFVIVAVATDPRVPRAVTGVAIGGAVAMGAAFAGPVTGASMNPARALGPALVAGAGDHLWLYLTAPVVGAVAAMWVYGWLRSTPVGTEQDLESGLHVHSSEATE